ncbi:hypothetical protein LOC67_12645 [Stieleria sp. JC731]|uniref:hypothetical protein n=1 Tax=Pirellulaceae TaxID=2691357 RepID=UPI001E54FD9E|nr:hypothetical protein [Stieleria sp. JC731]MCC9601396.1 hypothetical protein [Stieleria sp. JC731]
MRRTITGMIALGLLASSTDVSVLADQPTQTVLLDAPRWAMVPQEEAADDLTPIESPSLKSKDDDTLRGALEMLAEEGGDDELQIESGSRAPELDSDESNESLFAGRKTQFTEGRFALPPIAALTTDTHEIGNGETPKGFRQGEQAVLVPLPESGADRDASWYWSQRYWAASNNFSHPLYFEDRMLERHGHSRFPHLQPLASAGRFATQFAMLPYLVAITPPYECQYSLGYYRAGSCVPAFLGRAPYQRKAAIAQAAVMGGLTAMP